MRDLTVRLDALDPDAGAALRVIAYFDELLAHGAGLQAIVRGAAVLTGGAAALVDTSRHIRIQVDGAGRAGAPATIPDAACPRIPVGSGGVLWLEYLGPPLPVHAMVLERAAAAAGSVLDRTRGPRDRPAQDAASVEVLLDASATVEARAAAARRLHLTGSVRAVAWQGGEARIDLELAGRPGPVLHQPAPNEPVPDDQRAGIGSPVPVESLPASWREAKLALRLTAEGTGDEAGRLMVLGAAVGPHTPPVEDVRALERAARSGPGMLTTLDAVANAISLRAAAARLATVGPVGPPAAAPRPGPASPPSGTCLTRGTTLSCLPDPRPPGPTAPHADRPRLISYLLTSSRS